MVSREALNEAIRDFSESAIGYNDLISHPAAVDVSITGVGASAASVVAMAGDTVAISDNGFLMLQQAWAFATGDVLRTRKGGSPSLVVPSLIGFQPSLATLDSLVFPTSWSSP